MTGTTSVSDARRKNMQAVRSKDSQIELLLRSALWQLGVRYRLHVSSVIGKPDIVIRKYRIAVFVDSEFWHGKDWNNAKPKFKNNEQFWTMKIQRNIERDKEVNQTLADLGWTVLRFWGKEIKRDPDGVAKQIQHVIQLKQSDKNQLQ